MDISAKEVAELIEAARPKGEPLTLRQGTLLCTDELDPDLRNGKFQIVVLQRGWVVVGVFQRSGSQCEVSRCSVIRRWGTTRGLGQIAVEGPTADTKIDPITTMRVHELAIVASFEASAEKWSPVCK